MPILTALIGSPDIDRIYHVCKPALLIAHSPADSTASLSIEDITKMNSSARRVQSFMNLQTHIKDIGDLFPDIAAIAGTGEATADPRESDKD